MLSDASARRVAVPMTVAPLAGSVMLTRWRGVPTTVVNVTGAASLPAILL